MISFRIYILFLLGSLCWGAWAQQGLCANSTGFFDKLAQRDAIYEQSMRFSNVEDEQDYWNDQKQFEAQLRQKNPQGYFAYIKKKHLIYNDHLQYCEDQSNHGNRYHKQALRYALQEGRDVLALFLKGNYFPELQ